MSSSLLKLLWFAEVGQFGNSRLVNSILVVAVRISHFQYPRLNYYSMNNIQWISNSGFQISHYWNFSLIFNFFPFLICHFSRFNLPISRLLLIIELTFWNAHYQFLISNSVRLNPFAFQRSCVKIRLIFFLLFQLIQTRRLFQATLPGDSSNFFAARRPPHKWGSLSPRQCLQNASRNLAESNLLNLSKLIKIHHLTVPSCSTSERRIALDHLE